VGRSGDSAAKRPATEPEWRVGRFETHASFVAALVRTDEEALCQLYLAFAPLLREQCRAMGIPEADRDELVGTVLQRFVQHVIREQRAPREIARYLTAAMRNRARNHLRDDRRRHQRYARAYEQCTGTDERVVAECHSEYGVRAAAGEPEEPHARSAIAHLAAASINVLSAEERELLVGLGRHLPMRELAAQLGISYGAARVRLHRLRGRVRQLAASYVVSLAADDRKEMERFFRRAGVMLDRNPEQGEDR
jgi:RNA polymerase sigma factor (sigma-70 family)